MPTHEQKDNAEMLFWENGKCSCERVAYQTSMHRDAIGDIQEAIVTIDRTLNGDPDANWPGLRPILIEIVRNQTGKEPQTDALEKTKGWSDLYKYIFIGVGIFMTLAIVVPLVWPYLFKEN